MGAYVAAVYLVGETHRRGLPRLQHYFRVRAVIAGVCGLVLGVAVLVALWVDEQTMAERVLVRGWALIVLGVLALAATFWLAARGAVRGFRAGAIVGVAALVFTWAVAQYPYLLPFQLTIDQGAGASATLRWILIWFAVAVVLVGPALTLLFVLDQRGELGEDPTTSHGAGP